MLYFWVFCQKLVYWFLFNFSFITSVNFVAYQNEWEFFRFFRSTLIQEFLDPRFNVIEWLFLFKMILFYWLCHKLRHNNQRLDRKHLLSFWIFIVQQYPRSELIKILLPSWLLYHRQELLFPWNRLLLLPCRIVKTFDQHIYMKNSLRVKKWCLANTTKINEKSTQNHQEW